MQPEKIHRLMAEMAESRKLHEEALTKVQNAVYVFKRGLKDVKWNLETTAQRFSEIVREAGTITQDAIVVEMHRRAS